MLDRLAQLDPAAWDTGLSPENARACWQAALSCVTPEALTGPVSGTRPDAVLIVCSGNVFTAPLEWMLLLAARGVRVIVKPASGQEAAVRAMAACIPGVEVREWQGGDVEAEAAAMREVRGVVAFGGSEALAAIAKRIPPGVVYLPFGPRFGVAVVQRPTRDVVIDHALYDGRGCMSPAAVFARESDLDELAAWMAEAQAKWPRGPLSPAEAAGIRARIILARAVGEKRVGDGWGVLRMPLAQFHPEALPRVLVVYPFADVEEVRAAVAPWRSQLGTVASDLPGVFLGAPRMCAPGRMQFPGAGRRHDGVDVLAELWKG
ncbi:MAG: acyl-CoA reductase [Myxococcota bacterium]